MSQMTTTLGSYTTAPTSSSSLLGSFILEKLHAAQCAADEIVQYVRRWRHHACSPGIAEVPLHAQMFAECGAAARAHRQVGYLQCALRRAGFRLEYQEHGVGGRGLDR